VNDGFFDISDVSNLTWTCTTTPAGGMLFRNNGTVVKTGSGTTTMSVNYSGPAVVVQQGVLNQSSC
jgi:autotransporter-associated beta strand protein